MLQVASLWSGNSTGLPADGLANVLTIAQGEVAGPGGGTTLLEQINNGGFTGYVILALSVAAVSLIVIHMITIRLSRLMPGGIRDSLESALFRHDMDGALAICTTVENRCFLTRVVERGLLRYQRSAFGPFEFKDAIEEAGTEEVALLYRATDALGLIGAIAPMLGLLGTVIGMVGAFETIAGADSRPELLAGDISKALVTTLMGLSLAIPCMAAFTYFRNRIDSHAAVVANRIEEMMLPLEPAVSPGPPGGGSGVAAGVASPAASAAGAPGLRRSAQPPSPPSQPAPTASRTAISAPPASAGAQPIRAGIEESN